jgi:hypothetical protein
MNNASDATLRGMAAGVGGQVVHIVSVGAGNVYLAHQNAGSSAANRLINTFTSADTPLLAGRGSATYVYDDTTDRWRLVEHIQGGVIAYTPSWTSTGTAPALGNGTLTGEYEVVGSRVSIAITFTAGTTTTFGTGDWRFSVPITVTGQRREIEGYATDSSAGQFRLTFTQFVTGTTILVFADQTAPFSATVPFTWANADNLVLVGSYAI